jgi:ribosomal protein L44E
MESNKDEMQADLVRPAKRKRLQLSCTECTKKKAKVSAQHAYCVVNLIEKATWIDEYRIAGPSPVR